MGQQWGQPTPTYGGTPVPGTTPPSGAPSNMGDGLSQVEITAFEPTELRVQPGVKVTVSVLDRNTGTVVQANVASGVTDMAGKFYFEKQAPSPNSRYWWRLVFEPTASSPSFQKLGMDVPSRSAAYLASSAGQPERFNYAIAVCPVGVPSLVCAVAQAQLMWATNYNMALTAYGASPYADVQSSAAGFAFQYTPLDHPELKPEIETFRYWVADLAVYPKLWPTLIKNFKQWRAVFNAIPFPKPGGTDLFIRCARGIPVWKKMPPLSPKFFVSSYFPREDRKIEADMAFSYLVGLQPIYLCMEWKIKLKIKEMERSAKTWRTLGLITSFMLAPLAGQAAPTLIITDLATYTYGEITGEPIPGELQTIATAGVSLAAANPAALEEILQSGMQLIVNEYGENWDPIVQKLIEDGVPKVAQAAVADQVAGILGSPATTSGALDFVSLQSLGSVAAATAVKLVSNMIVAQGVKGVDAFKRLLLDVQNMDALVLPFMIWCINVLLLDRLFDAAAQDAAAETGTTDDFNFQDDIIDPAVEGAEAQGAEIPSSATKTRAPVIDEIGPVGAIAMTGVGVGAIVLAVVAGAGS